jgi:tetratricopeptide (TPR) repeat protein
LEPRKYWAFISYSHRDTKWAAWLHRSLESYHPPRQLVGTSTAAGAVPKRLSPVFRDREELASATDLGASINEALNGSACQIVICSPSAARSRWVNEEILAFKRLGREHRIFCLIVDGEPHASDKPEQADQECFPPALRYRLGSDGQLSSTPSEPIAADARPGKDGKGHAKLKLIAGVLGVGFDTLRRREQQRRNRRLFVLSCAATFGMVVTSSLATYALIQRRTAEQQRVRAEAEAETARQTTNFLVDLFRISDPSEARGNAVTAREMLDKGAARIDRELARQPKIRATLMDTVGTVYMGLGLYSKARPMLDGAIASRRSSGSEDPLALAVSLQHMGDLLTLQAQYQPAQQAYRDAMALQAKLPEDAHTQAERAKTLHGLGTLLEQTGRYAEADQALRQALKLQQSLYGSAHSEIAVTLKDLARVMDKGGDLNGAIPVMRNAVGMQRELSGTQPDPSLAEALNDLALLLEESGSYDESEKLYREAIEMKRRVFGDKHPEVAMGLNNLAMAFQDQGDLVRAESSYRAALAMQQELLGPVHPDVATTLNNLAFVQSARGDLRGALATEQQALAVYRKLFPGDNPEVARIMNRIGFWLTQVGDYAQAEQDLQAALAMRRRLFGPDNPDVASSFCHVAILQLAKHDYDGALQSARGAVAIFSPAFSATHWKTALGESLEGAALAGLGRYQEAEPLLERAIAILGKDGGAPTEYHRLAQQYLEKLRADRAHPHQSAARIAQRDGSSTP